MEYRSFDLDQLRALVAVLDCNGFTAAGRMLGTRQSTVSMQIRRLEAAVGAPLIVRLGRSVVATAAGEQLQQSAREMLALNDRSWGDLASESLIGKVRLGAPDDYVGFLSDIIRTFQNQYPDVTIELTCDLSVNLLHRMQEGRLDLALVTRQPNVPGGEVLRRDPLVWVAAPGYTPDRDSVLPLSVYPKDYCVFRDAMTSALTAAGRPWRIAYTTMSLTGHHAIVGAGLAVTALARSLLSDNLREITQIEGAGLPALPDIELTLQRRPGRPTEAARRLSELIAARLGDGGSGDT